MVSVPLDLRKLRALGFVDLGVVKPNEKTFQVARDIASAIGAEVFPFVEKLSAAKVAGSTKNTYAGNYGLNEFPLHSDLAHWYRPPRYLVLRCVAGSQHVSTRLLTRHNLEEAIPSDLMRRALFSPRRRLDGKMYLLRMLTQDVLRWDALFLSPKNKPAHELVALMNELKGRLPVQEVLLSEPGQTLVVDNWHVLHGRSYVPETDIGRSLDRVYLDLIEDGD